MTAVLRARIIKVGNSRGIRIPKVCLDQLGLRDEVELAVRPDRLVIRPARRARGGWEERFRAMAERGDDKLLDEPAPTKWEETEWEW
jgi:antitoxin MazE